MEMDDRLYVVRVHGRLIGPFRSLKVATRTKNRLRREFGDEAVKRLERVYPLGDGRKLTNHDIQEKQRRAEEQLRVRRRVHSHGADA